MLSIAQELLLTLQNQALKIKAKLLFSQEVESEIKKKYYQQRQPLLKKKKLFFFPLRIETKSKHLSLDAEFEDNPKEKKKGNVGTICLCLLNTAGDFKREVVEVFAGFTKQTQKVFSVHSVTLGF